MLKKFMLITIFITSSHVMQTMFLQCLTRLSTIPVRNCCFGTHNNEIPARRLVLWTAVTTAVCCCLKSDLPTSPAGHYVSTPPTQGGVSGHNKQQGANNK